MSHRLLCGANARNLVVMTFLAWMPLPMPALSGNNIAPEPSVGAG